MAYVQAIDTRPPQVGGIVTSCEPDTAALVFVVVSASDDGQEWRDDIDVTGKSELQRIYPEWIGWMNMIALIAATIGAFVFVWGLLVSDNMVFLFGAIVSALGLMVFLAGVRAAARVRFGVTRYSAP